MGEYDAIIIHVGDWCTGAGKSIDSADAEPDGVTQKSGLIVTSEHASGNDLSILSVRNKLENNIIFA